MDSTDYHLLAPRAAILHANHKRFSPGECVDNGRVQSRMLLWCLGGKGRIRVCGEALAVRSGQWFFLPWNHQIAYQADERRPFLLGGIHLIPDLKGEKPISFTIMHRLKPGAFGLPRRFDVYFPGLESARPFEFQPHSVFAALTETIVAWHRRGPDEENARLFAGLLLSELYRLRMESERKGDFSSPLLEGLESYVSDRLDLPLTPGELAAQVRISVSTLNRLFRAERKTSPKQWILRLKMERAKELLSSTDLAIEVVGERVGMEDPFHFSRVFRKCCGESARSWRRRAWL
jgi:AraC-like DNA-binding protein